MSNDNEGLAEVIINTLMQHPDTEFQLYFSDTNDGYDEYILHKGDSIVPIGENLIRFKYTEQLSETETVWHDVVLNIRNFNSMEVCE